MINMLFYKIGPVYLLGKCSCSKQSHQADIDSNKILFQLKAID